MIALDRNAAPGMQHGILTEAFRDYAGICRQPFSDVEMRKAKSLFRTADWPSASGWILPDGTMLDFNSPRYVDHAEIFRAFSDDRITGAFDFFAARDRNVHAADTSTRPHCTEWKEEALAAGLVRVQMSPTGVYVTVWRKPTPAQLDTLYDFVDGCRYDQYADSFGTLGVSVGDEYVEYDGVDDFARRAMNDIRRLSAGLRQDGNAAVGSANS